VNQEVRFNKIWDNRFQSPYITKSWAVSEWAKGRTDWLTFLIRVKGKKIIEKIQDIQKELTKFECVEPFPIEYFHITIKEIAFHVMKKEHPDEITQVEIQSLIVSVQEIIRDFNPFEIELMNLNNFKSTICIEGHDGETINNINGRILELPGIQKYKHDYPGFLPHLSIAQYKNSEMYEQLIERLECMRDTIIGSLKVDSFQLIVAELPIIERFPKLITLNTFYL
jgi:2'-5' RNA ligase